MASLYPRPGDLHPPPELWQAFVRADLDVLRAALGGDRRICTILGAGEKQLRAWHAGGLPPAEQADRLEALASAVRALTTVLLPSVILEWMISPRIRTEESPADLLRTGRFDELRLLVEETLQGDTHS